MERQISQRAGLVTASQKTGELAAAMLAARRDEWLSKVAATSGGAVLTYHARRTGRDISLLKQPTETGDGYFFCLNSLRDVEPQISLILDDHDMDSPPPEREDTQETIDDDTSFPQAS